MASPSPAGLTDPQKHVLLGSALVAACIIASTIGYMLIEDDWSLLEAFYMTIITLTTVGYREVHPLSPAGQLYTVLVLSVGLGLVLYTITRGAQAILEGELVDLLGRRRMAREIASMEQHFVVCGYGKVGRPVAEGLAGEGLPLCVIERDPELEPLLRHHGHPFIIGDATTEAVLRQAGVDRAHTLLALLASDAENLYLTMSARELRPGIRIIARATDDVGEARLRKAGADDVVSPIKIAGLRILQAALQR